MHNFVHICPPSPQFGKPSKIDTILRTHFLQTIFWTFTLFFGEDN